MCNASGYSPLLFLRVIYFFFHFVGFIVVNLQASLLNVDPTAADRLRQLAHREEAALASQEAALAAELRLAQAQSSSMIERQIVPATADLQVKSTRLTNSTQIRQLSSQRTIVSTPKTTIEKSRVLDDEHAISDLEREHQLLLQMAEDRRRRLQEAAHLPEQLGKIEAALQTARLPSASSASSRPAIRQVKPILVAHSAAAAAPAVSAALVDDRFSRRTNHSGLETLPTIARVPTLAASATSSSTLAMQYENPGTQGAPQSQPASQQQQLRKFATHVKLDAAIGGLMGSRISASSSTPRATPRS